MQNFLEIGKIVRVHGIKGAVKVISYVDEDFSTFKHVYLTHKRVNANIKKVQPLNGDAYIVTFDIMPDINIAETYKNQSVYIDRNEYKEFEEKVYLSDLINRPVVNENGEDVGKMVNFDDYGATIILTIKCGAVSYDIPYIEELIRYDKITNCFIINQQKFEDLRIWG